MKDIVRIKDDKYNNINYAYKYAALWSFGYLNGFGQSEGFYRTINEIGFTDKDRAGSYNILDIGCGVGRVACDYAKYFYKSKVIGLDESSIMLSLANNIVKTNKALTFETLVDQGFKKLNIEGFGLSNIEFVCNNLSDYYKNNNIKFDIITCINFIDRIVDLEETFSILSNLLATKGILILASPLNFFESKYWDKFGSVEKLKDYFKKIGLEVELSLDNLVYRELLDTRGAHEEYGAVIFKLRKL